jgi:two-component system response regulator
MEDRPMADLPRLLHIDDSDDDRLLFQRVFKQSGVKAELIGISNAFETLIFLDQAGTASGGSLPRLIVLDLTLPLVDGRDLLSHIRTNARYKHIPLIVLTGSNSPGDRERCRDFQVERFVIKPSTFAALAEVMPTFAHWLIQDKSVPRPWKR